jgi:hypothetical protein
VTFRYLTPVEIWSYYLYGIGGCPFRALPAGADLTDLLWVP